jgi:ribonuclease HII
MLLGMAKSGKVIGIDEVGTGAWAGPAYVCAVAVDDSWLVSGLKDSKELTKLKIAEMYHLLVDELHIPYVLKVVELDAINEHGIGAALSPMWLAAGTEMLERFPESRVFLDGERKPAGCGDNWFAIPNADAHIPCVMAAAIIAKYLRDQYMIEQSKAHPEYGWDTNMGYGTQVHREALNSHGVTALHRTSFRPVQKYMYGPARRFGAQEVSLPLYEQWVKDAAKTP